MLQAASLGYHDCRLLAERLAPNEEAEVLAMGLTPRQALTAGLLGGPSTAVLDDLGNTIGAFGWSDKIIWSLWAPLTLSQAKQVIRETPKRVKWALHCANVPSLHNWVHAENTPAIRWLKASGAFDVSDLVEPSTTTAAPVRRFQTKPYEELARLCATR